MPAPAVHWYPAGTLDRVLSPFAVLAPNVVQRKRLAVGRNVEHRYPRDSRDRWWRLQSAAGKFADDFANCPSIGRGKPLVLGTLLTIAGLFFFLGAVLTYPFERVSVTPTKLLIAQGVLGKGIAETIDLTTLDAIELLEARRSRAMSRGVSLTTIMRCHAKNSEINDVDMEGELRAAALPTVIKRANELGVKVFDSTVNESE